ncbi:hypothetical protein CDL15_Pgr003263 [Punica granatum]|uniref:Probable cytosolic iron-sulfur protein assembly protein CIAO1 homolog n=1 Tax=Punica granatum TaxID=22663 RepID=A0A218X412_PUNGR|nr:hypothetical protein CDL15_Pgr003263 [Punica granatum]
MELDWELRELQTLEGHKDRVWSVAWNPATGVAGIPPMFASCSGDKTVRVWEQTPSSSSWDCKVGFLTSATAFMMFRFLRGEMWLSLHALWCVDDGNCCVHLRAVLDETHTRTVRSCAWSPSGKLLATASFDATTGIWENVGDDFECVSTLEGHENEVKSVSWNASGSLLATCGRDKSVWIWEVLPGKEFECASVLQGHTQDVKMVMWHPTMDILFSCSYDNSVKVWAEDGDDDWHCVQTLNEANNGHSSTVWALSFNGSGDKMVTCSDDLTMKIWGTDLKKMMSEDGYAPWKGLIVTGAADDAIRLFVESKDGSVDEPSYKMILRKEKAHDMDVNSVQWGPGETRLLASASDDGTIKIWELQPVA